MAGEPRLRGCVRCTYTALASLRGILNAILDQEVSTATWSELTQVGGSSGTWRPGEDSSTLRMPCWNTLDTHLVAEATGEARGRAMVETLTALLEDVDCDSRGSHETGAKDCQPNPGSTPRSRRSRGRGNDVVDAGQTPWARQPGNNSECLRRRTRQCQLGGQPQTTALASGA